MSYTYADHKRAEEPAAKKENDAPQLSTAAARFGAGAVPPSVPTRRIDLPEAMRTKMENAFGADLSAVRLYESRAVADAGASAVTRGSNIAFAPGMLDFTSRSGQTLLGHELSHVVSQARGEVTGSGFLNDSALEARADREGAMAAAGEQIAMPTAAMSDVSAAAAAGPMQADKMSYEEKFDPAERANLKPTMKDRFDWRTEQMSWKKGPVGAMGKLGQRMLWGKQEEEPAGPLPITVLPEQGPDGTAMGDPLTILQFPEEEEQEEKQEKKGKNQHWWNKLSRKMKSAHRGKIKDVVEGEENPYAPTDPDEIVRQKAAAWGMSEDDVRSGTVYEGGPNPYAPTDPMEIARQKAAAWDMSVEDVLAGKLPPELQAKQDADQIDSLAKTTDEFDADQIDDLAKTTDEFDADQIDDLAQTADEFDADLDKRR